MSQTSHTKKDPKNLSLILTQQCQNIQFLYLSLLFILDKKNIIFLKEISNKVFKIFLVLFFIISKFVLNQKSPKNIIRKNSKNHSASLFIISSLQTKNTKILFQFLKEIFRFVFFSHLF